jgi:hypothetical protein
MRETVAKDAIEVANFTIISPAGDIGHFLAIGAKIVKTAGTLEIQPATGL